MSLLLRAAVWIGIYAALVLAPLLVAFVADPVADPRPFGVELGVACGFVAFSLIALELALVARIRAASDPFGTDVVLLFHRLAAVTAVGFVVAHPLILWGTGRVGASMFDPWRGPAAARTGALAFWSVVLVAVTSIWRRRLRLPYEVWRLGHRLLAVVSVGAMLAHVTRLGAYSRSPAVLGVLWGHGGLFAALLAWYTLARPLLRWRRPWEVVANRDEGGDARTLVLRPVRHAGLSFEPGQFAWLCTGATPFHPQHPISFSSSGEPDPDRRVEFTIKALGDWSRKTVPSLAPGARLWVDGPYGAFSPDRVPAQAFVLIAGGVGICPMRSMLLTMRDRGDTRPVLLVYAARNAARTAFAEELAGLARSSLSLRIVYVFEERPPDGRGEHGHVTADLLRRHLGPVEARAHFFVCGPPAMLDAMERVLPEIGVARDRVHTERYDLV